MTAYALRLANGMDTAPRMRAGDALGLAPAGPLQARNGLRPDGGGEVTVVEGTMMVDVSPLMGWVDGDTSDAQGGYPFVSDDTAQLTLADGDPGDDRTDTIVARVQDTAYDGGGVTDATVEVVEGVPGAGAPALPPTCIPIRDVLVPAGLSAGTGGLSSANLGADRRTYTAALGGVVNVTGVADRDAMAPTEGQPVWRRDTKALEVWDGSAWVPYHAATYEPEWTPLVLTSGWAARVGSHTPSYQLWPSGTVKLRGGIQRNTGNIVQGDTPFTAPSAIWPTASLSLTVAVSRASGTGAPVGRLDLTTAGATTLFTEGGVGNWLALDGVTYNKN